MPKTMQRIIGLILLFATVGIVAIRALIQAF